MADPLGVATAIVATVKATYKYLDEVKNAPETCNALRTKLATIQNILSEESENIAKEEGDDAVLLLTLLQPVLEKVSSLERWLKNISPDASTGIKFRKRAIFPALKAIKNPEDFFVKEITYCLGILNAYHDSKNRDELREWVSKSESIQKRQEEKSQHRRLMEWLLPKEFYYDVRHKSNAELRRNGTCEWLWDIEEFKHWYRSPSRELMWLYGGAGIGKSVLASSIIDSDKLKDRMDIAVVYHYCDFSDSRTTSPDIVLRSLLVQLLSSSPERVSELSDLISRMSPGRSPPSDMDELVELIVKASKGMKQTIIVIDALDECPDTLRKKLLKPLRELGEQPDISIIVTSRKEQDIIEAFQGLPSIPLEDQKNKINTDMNNYISKQLEDTQKYNVGVFSEDLKAEIQQKLVDKADGMFRWVQCQLDVIWQCPNQDDVRAALKDLPKGLKQTYDRVIRKILDAARPSTTTIAWNILTWVMGSTIPLSLSQLKVAITLELKREILTKELAIPDAEYILRICGSFLDLSRVEDSELVRFSHFTVKEYLERGDWEDSRLPPFHFSPVEVQQRLALLTMSFLMLDDFDEAYTRTYTEAAIPNNIYKMSRTSSLFGYAINNWPEHVRRCREEDNDIYQCIQSLSSKRYHWLISNLGTRLRLRRSLPSVVYLILSKRSNPFENKYSENAIDPFLPVDDKLDAFLVISILKRIPWITTRILTEYPEKMYSNLGGNGTPLIIASRSNNSGMIEAISNLDRKINHANVTTVESLVCLLRKAIVYMQPSRMQLPPRGKAHLNFNINGRGTALHVAVLLNSLSSVKSLIKAGVDLLLPAGSGITPLQLALGQPDGEIFDSLLEKTQYYDPINKMIITGSLPSMFKQLSCYLQQHYIAGLRWDGTCEWISKDKAYRSWKSNHGILWLYGPPGFGKTVLTSAVVSTLITQGNVVLFHYFDSDGSSNSEGINEIFRSFLVQCILSVPPHLAEHLSRFITSDHQPPINSESLEMQQLIDCIRIVAQDRSCRRIFIVVDALDKSRDCHDLFKELVELNRELGISILLTSSSNQEQLIGEFLAHDDPNLQYILLPEKRSVINLELRGYLINQISSHKKFLEYSTMLKSKIVDVLLDRAGGAPFSRLPDLFKVLEMCQPGEREIQEILERFPRYAESCQCFEFNVSSQGSFTGGLEDSDPSTNSLQSCVSLLSNLQKQLSLEELTPCHPVRQRDSSFCTCTHLSHIASSGEQARLMEYEYLRVPERNTATVAAAQSSDTDKEDILNMVLDIVSSKKGRETILGPDSNYAYALIEVLDQLRRHGLQVPSQNYRRLWPILSAISIQLCARGNLVPESYKLDFAQIRFDETSTVSVAVTRAARGIKKREHMVPVPHSGSYSHDTETHSVATEPVVYESDCYMRASILKWLDHPNIVPCLGIVCDDRASWYLVTLLMGNGDILSYVKEYPKAKPLELALGIARGIAFMHDLGISHNKLESSSILMDRDHQPRISDFTFAYVGGHLKLPQLEWDGYTLGRSGKDRPYRILRGLAPQHTPLG